MIERFDQKTKGFYFVKTADTIKAEITALEQRAIRPLLAGETDRVDDIKAQIEALRQELQTTEPKGD